MNIELWWPELAPATRLWLIDNNGDVLPAAVAGEIEEAGGSVSADNSLSDEETDWIEAVANEEPGGLPSP